MFLPPNVTSLLQLMNQSVNESTKRHYQRQLLRKLLLAEEGEESVLDLYNKMMIAEAWNLVKNLKLKRPWNRINGTSTKEHLELEKQKGKANELEQEVGVDEIVNIAKGISGCSECNVDYV
uniref:DDE-1 domain-containing protein n=1 Tax=Timema monikensis TaxID=170555 RepID=A0A7R9E4Q7_9NEOP|nr:unnamed protein product [Timema monikensis]